jgi:hypothetical protein
MSGQVFLDALSNTATAPDPLLRTMRARLQRTHPHLVVES